MHSTRIAQAQNTKQPHATTQRATGGSSHIQQTQSAEGQREEEVSHVLVGKEDAAARHAECTDLLPNSAVPWWQGASALLCVSSFSFEGARKKKVHRHICLRIPCPPFLALNALTLRDEQTHAGAGQHTLFHGET
jgi:hypothetical protein